MCSCDGLSHLVDVVGGHVLHDGAEDETRQQISCHNPHHELAVVCPVHKKGHQALTHLPAHLHTPSHLGQQYSEQQGLAQQELGRGVQDNKGLGQQGLGQQCSEHCGLKQQALSQQCQGNKGFGQQCQASNSWASNVYASNVYSSNG